MRVITIGVVLLASAGLSACGSEGPPNAGDTPLTQASLDELAGSLELTATLVRNMPATCPSEAAFGVCHEESLILKNTGAAANVRGFSLYFNSGHRLLSSTSSEFAFEHLQGDFYRLLPSSSYHGFADHETKRIDLVGEGCTLDEWQFFPRSYLGAPGLEPRLIPNTNNDDPSAYVAPFTTDEQLKCGAQDSSTPATAATRFDDNASVADLGVDAVAREIVPTPVEVKSGEGAVDLSRGLSLDASALGAETLARVQDAFRARDVPLLDDGVSVRVTVDPEDAAFEHHSAREAYRLTATEEGVTIVGADVPGAFYGVQTLLALLPADPTSDPELPSVEIPYDAPRYPYRGLHIDVARHFHGAAEIKKLLFWMAAYKLNALHFHLTDDEGWRLPIPGLPELTDLGARRCHDLDEHSCLFPALGSGPTTQSDGSGSYTREEFIDLLATATALHIEVIPEFDMPGHARAAVRAMAARATGGDDQYRLDDPDDHSEYRSVQGFEDNVANVCVESTYAFIAKVMDEVAAMYREAGAPLVTWHVGADELPAGAWSQSPACAALYAAQSAVKSTSDLLPYFLSRVSALAKERGFGLRGYAEGFAKGASDGAPEFLDPASDLAGNAVSVNWADILQWFGDTPAPLASRGYDLIIGNFDFFFFDHPQEADPKERGLPWATRFTSTRRLFAFISGNLAANGQLLPVCANGACEATLGSGTPIADPERVIGLEGFLWSELIRSDEHLEYSAFPRLLALAERAWHRAAWEPVDGMDLHAPIDFDALDADWSRFANTLGYKELPKLDRDGIRFRIDVPGARIVDGQLQANIATPGLRIEYERAPGEWVRYESAAPPMLASTRVRAVTMNGRAGRAVSVP